MPAPAGVEVTGRHVQVGDGYATTLAVTGYPAEVGPAWLEPLLAWPGRLDVAVHIDPIAPPVAAMKLRKQRARLESARRLDAEKGKLSNPVTDAAADDATGLADRVARGATRLFRVGVYLTVHAESLDALRDAVAQVKAVASSLLLDVAPATWRQLHGWTSTLPLGHDALRMTRVMDTDALAASFPLSSADLPGPLPGDEAGEGGVLYGVNADSPGVVWWDRFAQDNHNAVVLAQSGAGKSYLIKLETLRWLQHGATAAIIDPDDEYRQLAGHIGGTVIALGAAGVRVNPLDLPVGDTRPDALTRRCLFCHTVIAVLLGQDPPPAERAALDRAVAAAYGAAGITHDARTWNRPAPLLRDVAAQLAADGDDAAHTLAARLAPWVTGTFSDLFDGPTTHRPDSHLVVWSLRQLPDEQRPIGTLLALDAIWRAIDTTPAGGRRRLVVVDEAWTLLQHDAGARFLFRMAKASRKRGAGLTVVTQDAGDVLSTELGRAVVANAATQILLKQAPQAIEEITDAFGLTAGEARLLLSCRRGEGLLVAGTSRVAFRAVGSPTEHDLCRTDPLVQLDGEEDAP
ncbi:VirB4 family type IV secretion system protein [Actinocatenispora rupis]|uniref:VirB4 family type IV secretion system protein n=1 Tax=Actinocatenispora rupis TaxID=519421 RepID=UPI0019411D30|nr:DUF87 domain-containing protein [Actinocatenispora rupis]